MIRLVLLLAATSLAVTGCTNLVADQGTPMNTQVEVKRENGNQPVAPSGEKKWIVDELLNALDEIDPRDEDEDVGDGKDYVRQQLKKNDPKLREILGGNSRNMILQANKKPPVLVVGRTAAQVLQAKKAREAKAAAKKAAADAAASDEVPAEADTSAPAK
ncbi:MAG: hypothetical protein HQ581_26360 [Planctomycetes bacterium]|nr:hypothetical protein [Planctomycetota bacterium]